MNKETRSQIQAVLKMAKGISIKVRWRSNTVMPAASDRKSKRHGPSGTELVTRAEYQPGDPLKSIDQVETAKANWEKVYVRKYMQNTEVPFFVITLAGKSMDFSTTRVTKRQAAAELFGTILACVSKENDKSGHIAVDDKGVVSFLKPCSVKGARVKMLGNLLEPSTVRRRKSDYTPLTQALKLLPKSKRSVVFIIGDFYGLSDSDKQSLSRIGRIHDVVCLVVQDPRERALPSGFGAYELTDITTGKTRKIWLSEKNRRQYAENFRQHTEALLTFFKTAHCHSEVFATEEGKDGIRKLISALKAR